MTRRAEHAIELTGEALRQGYKKFIAVGGDGTLNEVANALLSFKRIPIAGLPPRDLFRWAPATTGGGCLGYPKQVQAGHPNHCGGRTLLQDVGLITYHDDGE
jgi:diacylglycerol kinase (ATP)